MFCGETSIQATSHFGQVAMPVKCKRWTCDTCGPWRQNCLMARCIDGHPNRFITITCRVGEFGSPAGNARAISRAWRLTMQNWRKLKSWNKGEYICVFEPHVSGWPHLHILFKGAWVSQRWLSSQMAKYLNSPIVDIRRIKSEKQAAFYVAKYFSKGPQKFGNSKRYWTSKNWPKLSTTGAEPAFHKGFPCEIVQATTNEIFNTWHRYNKNPWTRGRDIIGWGALINPCTQSERSTTPVWATAFGFKTIDMRARRAPMARGRGVRG